MTLSEFSDGFTTLLNSFSTTIPHGSTSPAKGIVLDEYEKSLFLTKAQEEFVINQYNGLNLRRKGFEEDENATRWLDQLVDTKVCESANSTSIIPITEHSFFFSLPDDHLFTTFEFVTVSDENTCINGKNLIVVPTTRDELHRKYNNPFMWPKNKRAFRLNRTDNVVEVVCFNTVDAYTVSYLKKPSPIVLVDLNGVSINGVTEATECSLHPSTHKEILDRAVQLALASKSIG